MTGAVEKIFLENSVANHPLARAAITAQERFQGATLPIIPIDGANAEQLRQELHPDAQSDPYFLGKKILVLAATRGEKFKSCPGTQGAVCCNYTVFNHLSGCPYNCSYCYLGQYLNRFPLTLQVDLENSVDPLITHFRENPKILFRVGTGEISDSLALPAGDPLNQYLIERFSSEANVLLELKTKSDRIEALLHSNPQGRVIVSWSLSPRNISRSEEHGTATVENRIAAAKKVLAAGYQVGFHLDPILFRHSTVAEWKKDYRELLEEIFSEIPAGQIAWISLGALRLLNGLRERMMQRFPESPLAYAEMVPGIDGKLRYPKPQRKEMFQFLFSEIARLSSIPPPVYLCMEAREVWQKTLGETPDTQGRLRVIFSHAV